MLYRVQIIFVVVGLSLRIPAAHAEFLSVYGGPTWTYVGGVSGYSNPRDMMVTPAGIAVGNFSKNVIDTGFATTFPRSVRWDSTNAPTEIPVITGGSLGLTPSSWAQGIDAQQTLAGTIANNGPSVAVRWDLLNNTPVVLPNPSGVSGNPTASAISPNGWVVGKVSGAPVRWDSSGTSGELLDRSRPPGNGIQVNALAINDSGVVVGFDNQYFLQSPVFFYEEHALRWDAGGTTVTLLGDLGMDNDGHPQSRATHINNSGMIAGESYKFVAGKSLGPRAVRWGPTGTAAIELGGLGTDPIGYSSANVADMNQNGTIVGGALKYDAAGNSMGGRAVRWDLPGTFATELQPLDLGGPGSLGNSAHAINSTGQVVGDAWRADSGSNFLWRRAVLWQPDGTAVDLNALIDPSIGWTLEMASDISDTGWVVGLGSFDPDGPGGRSPYPRAYLISAASIPEPGISLMVLPMFLGFAIRRRGWRQ